MADLRPRCHVVIPRRALEGALRDLVLSPHLLAWSTAGTNRTPRATELLCRDLRAVRVIPSEATGPGVILVLDHGTGTPGSTAERVETELPGLIQRTGPLALLTLARGRREGHLVAELIERDGSRRPVDAIAAVGAGMQRLAWSPQGMVDVSPPVTEDQSSRWSRLLGALGAPGWQRFRSLRYALVGVGRNGSLVAESLAKLGVAHLTLIDPDRIELHNTDAMACITPDDVGRFKVEAVRDRLLAVGAADLDVTPVAESILTMRALHAVKQADTLIVTVDDDGARVAAAVLATLYARPLLDIASGVLGHGAERRTGADARLTLPGEPRCLLCLGGISNPAQVHEVFSALPRATAPRPLWHEQRAGSLLPLNQAIVGQALLRLLALVSEPEGGSTWTRLEVDRHGAPTSRTLQPPEQSDCQLCRHAGAGDEGLTAVRTIAASWA